MTYLRTSFGNICQDMAGAEGFEPSARGFGAIYYTKRDFLPHLANGYISWFMFISLYVFLG